jgi:hypothetical protein
LAANDGKTRALLAFAEDTAGLYLCDKDGEIRAFLSLGEDGRPRLDLSDKDGKTRAMLGMTALEDTSTAIKTTTSESALVLFDKEGKVIYRAP